MIGVSSDSVSSHCRFAESEELPFPILSDMDDLVRKKFGVQSSFCGLLPGRVTFVIDRDRRIRHVHRSLLGLRNHVRSALDALTAIAV